MITETRGIELFTLKLRQQRKKEFFMPNNIEGSDLLNVLNKHLVSYIDNLPKDDANKTIAKIESEKGAIKYTYSKEERYVCGIVKSGRFGKIEDVIDIEHPDDEPVFTIGENHSVQKPFFFLILVPERKDTCIIAIEKIGTDTISKLLLRILRDFITANFDNLSIDISRFIDDEIVSKYLKHGFFSEISLTRNSLPADIADRYGLKEYDQDEFSVSLVIKAKGKKYLKKKEKDKILKMIDEKVGFFAYSEFEKLGFDEHVETKVVSVYDNKPRRISLANPNKIVPTYELDVKLNERKHSDFESIRIETVSLIKSLKLEL